MPPRAFNFIPPPLLQAILLFTFRDSLQPSIARMKESCSSFTCPFRRKRCNQAACMQPASHPPTHLQVSGCGAAAPRRLSHTYYYSFYSGRYVALQKACGHLPTTHIPLGIRQGRIVAKFTPRQAPSSIHDLHHARLLGYRAFIWILSPKVGHFAFYCYK